MPLGAGDSTKAGFRQLEQRAVCGLFQPELDKPDLRANPLLFQTFSLDSLKPYEVSWNRGLFFPE
jgi:hypothetical protein